jgi:mycothiol system anti-sigma-R factor
MDSTLPPHDCNKFVEQVFLVLDGELSDADTEIFIQDIERCSHCLQHYNIEKELKAFITNRMERKTCSDVLRESIVQQIRGLES